MSKGINLSHNELWIVLRRTFEALYGHERDYLDMAGIVWWLECYGHDGIASLITALPNMDKLDLERPKTRDISPTRIDINCGGQSVFTLGRSLCDLAVAGAAQDGFCEIRLENLADSQALFGALNYAAQHGMAAMASCERSLAIFQPHADCPVIYDGAGSSIATLICAQAPETLSRFYNETSKVIQTPETQLNNYRESLDKGVNLATADYDILYEFGDRILVETSEASRRGAGE